MSVTNPLQLELLDCHYNFRTVCHHDANNMPLVDVNNIYNKISLPLSTRSRAVSKPMPELAPVTITTLPSIFASL